MINEQQVWVVFTGHTDIAWLKILKPGFRHCFVLLNDGNNWISLDPLSAYTDIEIHHHIEAVFNLPQWLESQGYQVVQAVIDKDHKTPAPVMIYSCVEFIKRVLGIHARTIITPWQLFNYLIKYKNNELQKT